MGCCVDKPKENNEEFKKEQPPPTDLKALKREFTFLKQLVKLNQGSDFSSSMSLCLEFFNSLCTARKDQKCKYPGWCT